MLDGIDYIFVKLHPEEVTGEVGGKVIYNYFFERVKDSLFQPLFIEPSLDFGFIEHSWQRYLENLNRYQVKVIEISIEREFRDIIQCMVYDILLNKECKILRKFMNWVVSQDTNIDTRDDARLFLFMHILSNGIISSGGKTIIKGVLKKGDYGNFLNELNSPTPVIVKEGGSVKTFIYYPNSGLVKL